MASIILWLIDLLARGCICAFRALDEFSLGDHQDFSSYVDIYFSFSVLCPEMQQRRPSYFVALLDSNVYLRITKVVMVAQIAGQAIVGVCVVLFDLQNIRENAIFILRLGILYGS
jgi:hypothetical protein